MHDASATFEPGEGALRTGRITTSFMSRNAATKRKRRVWDSLSKKEKDGIRRKLFREQFGICLICYQPMDDENFTVDHVRALSRGGNSGIINLQATHRDCNQIKGSGTNEEARRKMAARLN